SSISGPGASQYAFLAGSPSSGSLGPQQSTSITLTAMAVPSPAPKPRAADLAAQITITTDVPLDTPHAVALKEVPLGDHLSVSVGNLRFGQVPTGMTATQVFTLTNNANPGSPPAVITTVVAPAGSPYSGPGTATVAAGATIDETVSFRPQ